MDCIIDNIANYFHKLEINRLVIDELIKQSGLGSTYFQHAILFTVKLIDKPESNDVDQKKWAQNIRVRVGDKEDYNQNDDCTDDLLLDVNA